jgi:FkbM family methyltransferase
MNFAYLYVNEYTGQDRVDFFSQLKKTVSTLKEKQRFYDNIYVFTTPDQEAKEFCEQENLVYKEIAITKQYYNTRTIIDILAEKIRILKDFDPALDVVLLDVDTLFLGWLADDEWNSERAVIWDVEYFLTDFRNLHSVLPKLPWYEVGISFNRSFRMYNTGVVYIPKDLRKEVCEKALWIVDKLNDGTYKPEVRHGNKLDEQIGLSIALHHYYGRFDKMGAAKVAIHHFWEEKAKGIRWWETEQRITDMDDVFLNLPQILEYVTPESYLDIGAYKGQHIEFVMAQLPTLKRVELVEGARHCEWDLNQLFERTGVQHKIAVLSDCVKEVNFYLDTFPDRPTGTGNSYYKEDSPVFKEFPSEVRETVTLDELYPNGQFDLIKLDTQGSELDILKGGSGLISRAKAIIVEENSTNFNIGAPEGKQIKQHLEANGYTFVKYMKWWGGWIHNTNGNAMWYETVDSLYVKTDILRALPPLPISVGILSWKSSETLDNTLASYKKNGLFEITDDVCILFQEASKEDKEVAKKYGIPYIALDRNVGIGRGFVMLCEQADNPHVLLLEHDWELTETFIETRHRLRDALNMLRGDTDVVRLRSRRNPGFPLYTYDEYFGNELTHYDEKIDQVAPHLMDAIHWVQHPDQAFEGKIFVESGHYVATSRWANWTNNPCLHRRDFYIELVGWFADRGMLLEPEISHWWSRQQFKVAASEGLFTHNDIEKFKSNVK